MIVMPSNDSGAMTKFLWGMFPSLIGWCITPHQMKKPWDGMFWILDNGVFQEWNPMKFVDSLRVVKEWDNQPLFVVVPDVVGDHVQTRISWDYWADVVIDYGFRPAFVCQDGCEPKDVPKEAFACFIGGAKGTGWKMKNAWKFKGLTPWLHIGRVNTWDRLKESKKAGADSVDGSGWYRGRGRQFRDLIAWTIVEGLKY